MINTTITNPQSITTDQEKILTKAEKEIKTRFELLPKEVQEMITSSNYQMQLFELAKKYKLTYDQLGELELETTATLLGMTKPSDFGVELAEALKIKKDVVDPLVKEISEQVFRPIRASLEKIYGEIGTMSSEAAEKIPSTGVNIKTEETAILEQAGIGIIADKPIVNTNIPMPSRQSVMTGVQNPPKFEPKKLNDLPKPGEKEMEIASLKQNIAIPTTVSLIPQTPKIPEPPKATMVNVLPKQEMVTDKTMDMIAQKLSGGNASIGTTASYMPLSPQKMPEPPKATPIMSTPPASNTPSGTDHYREPVQ